MSMFGTVNRICVGGSKHGMTITMLKNTNHIQFHGSLPPVNRSAIEPPEDDEAIPILTYVVDPATGCLVWDKIDLKLGSKV